MPTSVHAFFRRFGYNYFGNLATDKVEVLLRSADGIPHADYTELGDDMDVIRLGVNAVIVRSFIRTYS